MNCNLAQVAARTKTCPFAGTLAPTDSPNSRARACTARAHSATANLKCARATNTNVLKSNQPALLRHVRMVPRIFRQRVLCESATKSPSATPRNMRLIMIKPRRPQCGPRPVRQLPTNYKPMQKRIEPSETYRRPTQNDNSRKSMPHY